MTKNQLFGGVSGIAMEAWKRLNEDFQSMQSQWPDNEVVVSARQRGNRYFFDTLSNGFMPDYHN